MPGILLLLVQVMFAGQLPVPEKNLFLFPAITVASLLQVLLATFTMLALSSLSKSSRYVAILYAGIIFFTAAIYGVLYAITGSSALSWISPIDEPGAGRRRHLPPHAALHDALAGLAHRHRRAHRRVDFGSRAAGARRRGGHVSAPGAGTPIVTADHVSKWYGQVIGLNDVSVNVPPGITGLLGPNGAGKSTFMKLITGQLKPSKGVGDGARRADLGQSRSSISRSASARSRTRSTSG